LKKDAHFAEPYSHLSRWAFCIHMPFPPHEKVNISVSVIPSGAATIYRILILLFRLVTACQYMVSLRTEDILPRY
jgi:hypothetical protein